MKKITIPLSGITRNTDDAISQDGECIELINARVKNNSIIPVGKPIQQKAFPEKYSKGFYHSQAKRYIFIKPDGTLIAYNDQLESPERLSTDVSNVENVDFIGYTLCAMTSIGIKYFLFTKGHYNYIGDKPNFTINIFPHSEKDIELEEAYTRKNGVSIYDDIASDEVPQFFDALDSFKNKAMEPYQSEDRFTEPICVRAAVRTHTGNYICHSPLFVVFPEKEMNVPKDVNAGYGKLKDISVSRTVEGEENALMIKQKLKSFCVGYEIDDQGCDSWRDIITSIDIFVSRPFSIIDVERNKEIGINIYDSGTSIAIEVLTCSKASMEKKIVEAASLMYLVKSVKDAKASGDLTPPDVNNEILPDDQFSRNLLHSQSTFGYNGKLHLGNIQTILFSGFSKENELFFSKEYFWYNGYRTLPVDLHAKIFTYINTDTGVKVVFNEEREGNLCIFPFFCYPDYRAEKAEIYASYIDIATGEQAYKKTTLPLTRANTLNIAYYLGWDKFDARVRPIDLSQGTTISKEEFDNPGITIDNIEDTPNKIKVSALNDPFTFPAEQTYTVSNGTVIGMASATAALSQGQFGQFPLYVFCDDGIYALAVGTGQTAYASSSPVSRDACTNTESICSIDNAIVFASEAGLMILSGSTVQKISDKVDGYLPSSLNSSPVIQKILDIPHLPASKIEFRDYIANSSVGYIYEEKEIIVANKNFPYSYVFNLQSKEWHKISETITNFINSYPKALAIFNEASGCAIYDLHNPHRTINDIAIITRPIKFGSLTHKRILQSAIRGIVKPSMSDLYFRGEPVLFRGENVNIFSQAGFYILGSNDAEHFSLLAGTERLNDIRDLITKMNKTKAYKYFMFCLVGGVRTDVALNYIEVMADETFVNRLR